jgi:hypothetical protein
MYKLYKILHFVLKKHHNCKMYENMLTILCFIFLDLCNFVLVDVMYSTPHLHVVKHS